MIVNEGGVKAAVKKALTKHDWFWWMPPANGYGKTGISDFNALKNGVFLAVETKFGKNVPTAMQKGFLSSVKSCDCFAFVVNEQTLELFVGWLGAFDRATIAQSKGQDVAPEDGALMLNAIRAMQADF